MPINQTSPFTPSLAFFNGSLFVAFITNDLDSATGVPSNSIFLCSTTDGVSKAMPTFFNQYSKCAPSLAVWNGKLHITPLSPMTRRTVSLSIFRRRPTIQRAWTATVVTHQTSANAPSLAVYPSGSTGKLYLAFVAENGSNDIFVSSLPSGGGWSKAAVTGQSCHFSPSLAVGESLYLVFAAANGSKDLLFSSLNSNGTWSEAVALNQSTSATPCAVAFGSGLATGFVANNSSGEVLLAYSLNPSSSWTGGNVDIKQQSAAGPAVAVAPFACCHELLTYQGKIGGNTNYSFWAGLGSDNKPIPVTGLVVEINIDEPLVVSPTQGVQAGSPIGFQINGIPPIADQQPGRVQPVGHQLLAIRRLAGSNMGSRCGRIRPC